MKTESKKAKPIVPGSFLRSSFNDDILIPVRIRKRRADKEHEELIARSVARHREEQANAKTAAPSTTSAEAPSSKTAPSVKDKSRKHRKIRQKSSAARAARKRIVEERKSVSSRRPPSTPGECKQSENVEKEKQATIDQKVNDVESEDLGLEGKNDDDDVSIVQRLYSAAG